MQAATTLMQADKLSKLIGQIGRASAKLVEQVQIAAIQCIAQSIVHRNATPAMQLFEALGSGARRDALVKYFEMFGNLSWSKAEKKVIFIDMEKIPGGRKLEWTEEYAAKVAEVVWLKAKAEPQPKSIFDVDEEAAKFIERLVRAKGRGAELKNATLLERLQATYHAYVAEQYSKTTTAVPSEQDVQAAHEAGDTVQVEKLNKLREQFGARPVPVGSIPVDQKVLAAAGSK